METPDLSPITVETVVNVPVDKAWEVFNEPEQIKKWAFASDDWHAPYSENDLRTGGKIKTTMAAKDGSMSFDFEGTYTHVVPNSIIEYALGDGRTVKVVFEAQGDATKVTETFDPEGTHPREMQQGGWQAILNNYKKQAEISA
jgi:uncharacterized protein YndB with AHSA1/START domain